MRQQEKKRLKLLRKLFHANLGETMVQTEAVVTEVIANNAQDLSILGLISGADLVVKAVLLMLFLASIWSWAIIIDKHLLLNRVKKQIENFEKIFWSGQLLDQLYERLRHKAENPLSVVFVIAMDEWSRQKVANVSSHALSFLNLGLKERIGQVMEVAKNEEMEKLEKNLTFLAVVGSTSPFIGLFGTVWGIMNSFKSIAAMKNATISVVAPGIAEALFATAIGLVAAIPAVIFYNFLSSQINTISSKSDSFSSELGSLLSQEIDRGVQNGDGFKQ
jgi:biopolymer transport protein TolQ